MMGYCYFFLGEYDKAFEELNPIMDDIYPFQIKTRDVGVQLIGSFCI